MCYDDNLELNKGYIEASKQSGRDIMATLSPQAQQIAIFIGKCLKENHGSKKTTSPNGGETSR